MPLHNYIYPPNVSSKHNNIYVPCDELTDSVNGNIMKIYLQPNIIIQYAPSLYVIIIIVNMYTCRPSQHCASGTQSLYETNIQVAR